MGHLVALEYEGGLVDLTAGDNLLGQYSIKPARLNQNGSYDTVQERVSVVISGTSATDLQENIHTVERWLSTTAERKAVGEGAKLYLQVRPEGYTSTYRAEILEAVFVPAANTLELWPNFQVEGAIEFTRSPYWEGPRTQLTLSNRYSALGTTNWLRIDNRNDATHDAFVDIAQGYIDGTIPAPLEIHLRNDEATGASWGTFYIGVDARSGPTNLEPILEGEDQTGGGGSNSASSDASGGSVWGIPVTAADTHLYPRWTIPSAWADKFRGRFVRVLLRAGASAYDWVYQVRVRDQYNLITLFAGRPRSASGSQIIDLGTVPIPPVAYTSDLAEQVLQLDLYHTAGSTNFGTVDFIVLLPTDSGRTIKQVGMQIPAGDWVIFDEIEKIWVSNESDLKHPIFTPRGPGVLAFPEVANRLWIFHDGGTHGDTGALKSIKVYYRPRRLTL